MNRWPQVGRLNVGDVERLSLKEVLEESSPVYYRGEQVGEVRANSKFWPVSGFDVKGGIFSGLELQLRSLKALVSGGIAFATPDKDMGPLTALKVRTKAGISRSIHFEAVDLRIRIEECPNSSKTLRS
jgi:hypothetical protein